MPLTPSSRRSSQAGQALVVMTLALIAMLALVPAASFAHGNMKPQHGGIVQMSGETVFELVVKPASVELYVSEDDDAVAPADATANLVITVGGKETDVPMSAGGTGRLQSRTFKGLAGSPANGMFAYVDRLDLTNAVGAVNIACIDWMSISFGPVVNTLDYDSDRKPDQVFVVTSGGLGTIGLASAVQTADTIRFKFSKPVCEGGAPGKGDSSFFWGLVSKSPAKDVTAIVHETGGATHVVKARSPM